MDKNTNYKKISRKLTIMVMAGANQKIKRFQISKRLLYLLYGAVFLLAVSIPGVIAALAAAVNQYAELRSALQEENALLRAEWSREVSQKEATLRTKEAQIVLLQEEIVRLTEEARAVAAKVAELKMLEREILQYTQEENGETPAAPGAAGGSDEAGGAALWAALSGSDPDAADAGGPVRIASVGVGGLYRPQEPEETIRLSSLALQSLEELSAEADRLGQSLGNALEAAEKLQFLRSITPSIYPTTSTRITSSFGYRKDPFTGRRAHHDGIDLGGRTGDPVFAAADGTVVQAGYDRGAGNHIVIRHGNGIETVYMHLSKVEVKKGQNVKKGEQIGKLGSTGRSTGPHLHYEVRRNGEPVNPKTYLPD